MEQIYTIYQRDEINKLEDILSNNEIKKIWI